MPVRDALNRTLDAFVRPQVGFRSWSWPAFRVCAGAGVLAAVGLAALLAASRGLSLWSVAALVAGALLTFLVVAFVTKIVLGIENYVFYHQYLAVLAVTGLLLWLFRWPALPYLDVGSVALALFLASGRLGCLLVGCCHGWPHQWGVCYGSDHVAAGHTYYYTGVRLFPVQAVEAFGALAIASIGSALVLGGGPPGSALAWCLVAYGLLRFGLEFARGDPSRPYLGDFSEAQWTSLVLVSGVAGAEIAGWLPFVAWHAAAAASLIVAVVLSPLVWRHGAAARRLRHPHHVQEIADAIARLAQLAAAGPVAAPHDPQSIPVEHTTRGVRLSASVLRGATGPTLHYALSASDGALTMEGADAVAGIIAQLLRVPYRLIPGSRGIFHLLIEPPPRAPGVPGAGETASSEVPHLGHEFSRVRVLAAQATDAPERGPAAP